LTSACCEEGSTCVNLQIHFQCVMCAFGWNDWEYTYVYLIMIVCTIYIYNTDINMASHLLWYCNVCEGSMTHDTGSCTLCGGALSYTCSLTNNTGSRPTYYGKHRHCCPYCTNIRYDTRTDVRQREMLEFVHSLPNHILRKACTHVYTYALQMFFMFAR
jgi:hypothetical protein